MGERGRVGALGVSGITGDVMLGGEYDSVIVRSVERERAISVSGVCGNLGTFAGGLGEGKERKRIKKNKNLNKQKRCTKKKKKPLLQNHNPLHKPDKRT